MYLPLKKGSLIALHCHEHLELLDIPKIEKLTCKLLILRHVFGVQHQQKIKVPRLRNKPVVLAGN